MMRSLMLFLLLSTVALAGPVAMNVGNGDIAIAYDPTQPNDKISIIWLSYCIGRLHYVVEHRSQYPQKISGELIPQFKEEIAGRFIGLDTYKNLLGTKFEADGYWEDIRRVSDAGFLDEYVWTFFHRDTWLEDEKPAKLSEFAAWSKLHLADHMPKTYGTLVEKKG